jgi:uncharacterized RDD family membrane protein YckC
LTEPSQTKLLRIAAFLVDALSIAIILVLPASIVSYAMTWASSPKGIQLVWWAALAVLMVAMLLRDGFRGRSVGKHLLGLRLLTPKGEGCSYGRSFVRNLPLVIPGWNVLEVLLVLFGRPRTGDRLAKTSATEE